MQMIDTTKEFIGRKKKLLDPNKQLKTSICSYKVYEVLIQNIKDMTYYAIEHKPDELCCCMTLYIHQDYISGTCNISQ